MTLPILETPSYEMTLPSADVKVKFRPFLVKEEKILLQALESEDQKQIINALKEIVSACTFGVLNVNELPTFDLEYIFLQIRAKSVGEIAKLKVLCPDDKTTYADVSVDLSKIEVQVDDKHTNKIIIDENKKIGMIMKYPTLGSVDPSTNFTKEQTSQVFALIANSIYQIFEGDKVYLTSDYTKDEINKFIESLSAKAFSEIQNFYTTMPKLTHEIEVENPKTKVKSKVILQGLTDFFG
jgi:predicted secreted protein/citrate lyase gamma subunit